MDKIIDQLRQDIERFLDLMEQADDPEMKDRLQQSIQRKMRELKAAKQHDAEAQAAIDVLDQTINTLVKGKLNIAQSKLDIKKLKTKLDFLDKNV